MVVMAVGIASVALLRKSATVIIGATATPPLDLLASCQYIA
jgi:hypothetical protein